MYEMDKLEISINNSSKKTIYPIYLGNNIILEALLDLKLDAYQQVVIIQDKNLTKSLADIIKNLYPKFNVETYFIEASEDKKNIEVVTRIWTKIHLACFDRHCLIINYGGGLTTDLGGFVAATYMRGVDFINIPTSLLADIDASIGGKVGVNLDQVKNIIGAFKQPKAVIIDVAELNSLPKRELTSGYAEMIKHALIYDAEYFKEIEAHSVNLSVLIRHSCQIKAFVVASDEKECGMRKILNFGHTFGHALEALSYQYGKPLLHGEAVAIGMVCASRLSSQVGVLPESEVQRIIQVISNYGLPTKIPFKVSCEECFLKMQYDKKSVSNKLKWVLLSSIGVAVYDQNIEDDIVRQVILTLM